MPGSLQNKLQQFETAPPAVAWEKIAERLDQEFVAGDAGTSSKVEGVAIAAPAGLFDKIAQELDGVPQTFERTRTIPIFYKRLAAAAVIAAIALGSFYFFNGGNKVVDDNRTENKIVNKTPETVSDQPASVQNDTPKTLIASVETKKFVPVRKAKSQQSTSYFVSEPEQQPLYELHTVSALQPVLVSAPPLRDKKGNIILDLSMISNPDDEYITVTGPNGKQTKISSKFLSCLSYINANITSNETDSKAIQCKTQFEEWRKRLLSEPAFIPTANNFFDIFELKDMLQEM